MNCNILILLSIQFFTFLILIKKLYNFLNSTR
nr:MAG TPA: hypothetical protein [Caudoviricetes sp.]DAN31251.1 MAG TPA: hypothetical protein [Caudoviricetes sp.]DAR18542.1 MAG TPA: hypothetical protein [Caudoviricetes sp.]